MLLRTRSSTAARRSPAPRLYIATASSCDTSTPYHGQVVRVSITNGAILQRWYPTGNGPTQGGGIWGPGGVSVPPPGSPDEAWVYALTGNALASPENAAFGDHVVKLTTTLAVSDSSAPGNPGTNTDLDFGATATLFQPPGCPPMLAAFQKSGHLFIYNRNNIGAGPMHTMQISQSTNHGTNVGLPAYDPKLNQLYIAAPTDSPTGFNNAGLLGLAISGAPACAVSRQWQQRKAGINRIDGNPAIPPIVANGVVYYADGVGSHVYALDAATGQIRWSTSKIQGGIFASPMVVNGQLYIAGGGSDHTLRAFGL